MPSNDFVGNVAGNNVIPKHEQHHSGSIVKKVRLETLDRLAQEKDITKCDYMKVDIEGAELFFFKGAKNFISNTRPVIQFEYNKFWLERSGIGPSDFEDFFSPLGYNFYIEEENKFVKLGKFDASSVSAGLVDLLVVPNERISF